MHTSAHLAARYSMEDVATESRVGVERSYSSRVLPLEQDRPRLYCISWEKGIARPWPWASLREPYGVGLPDTCRCYIQPCTPSELFISLSRDV